MQLELRYDQQRDSWSARHDGKLYALRKGYNGPINSAPREYMIVSRLGKHPTGFVVEPVDSSKHILVRHSGFECAGSMCRTDAIVKAILDRGTVSDIDCAFLLGRSITPGRVHTFVRITDNVNSNWSRPIYDASKLEAIRKSPLFNPSGLRMCAVEARKPLAYYTTGHLKPSCDTCYVLAGELRACGLNDPSSIGSTISW